MADLRRILLLDDTAEARYQLLSSHHPTSCGFASNLTALSAMLVSGLFTPLVRSVCLSACDHMVASGLNHVSVSLCVFLPR